MYIDAQNPINFKIRINSAETATFVKDLSFSSYGALMSETTSKLLKLLSATRTWKAALQPICANKSRRHTNILNYILKNPVEILAVRIANSLEVEVESRTVVIMQEQKLCDNLLGNVLPKLDPKEFLKPSATMNHFFQTDF